MNLRALLALTFSLALWTSARADVVFVSASDANTVFRISSNGTATAFLTTGLNKPTGIAFDSAGNAYVASFASGTGDGTIKQFPVGGGMPVDYATGLNGPTGLAFDSNGVLYAAIANDDRVVKIITPSNVATFATLPTGAKPQALAFDPADGLLYVANKGNNTISKVTAGGMVSVPPFSNDVTAPSGVAFDAGGQLLCTHNGDGGSVVHFNPHGNANGFVKNLGAVAGLGVDTAGNLYVGDPTNDLVRKITSNKNVSTFAPNIDGPALFAVRSPQLIRVATQNEELTTAPVRTKFRRFFTPALAANGDLAYRAMLVPTVGGVIAANDTGIWVDTVASGRRLVARETLPGAPDTDGVFASFSEPVIDAGGRVAFVGTLRSGVGAGQVAGKLKGIWAERGGQLHLVARQGDQPVPGIDPVAEPLVKFAAFTALNQPGPDSLAFTATLSGSPANKNAGLWVRDPAGAVQLVLRKGAQIPIGIVNKTITGFRFFSKVPFSTGQGRSGSGGGDLCFVVAFTDLSKAILRRDGATGMVDLITYKGEVLTSAPVGDKLVAPSVAAVNDNLDVAFRSALVPGTGDVGTSNNLALFRQTGVGVREVIARKGFIADDTDSAVWASFSDPAIDGSGGLAFRATLRTGVGAPLGHTTGLWATDSLGALYVAARQGDPAVGASGTPNYGSFTNFTLSANGALSFFATLTGSGITTANNLGLWASGADLSPQLVVRKGDKLDVDGTKKTVTTISAFGTTLLVGSEGRHYTPTGEVAFMLKFSDVTSALYRVTLP
jgi:hypothetical protein